MRRRGLGGWVGLVVGGWVARWVGGWVGSRVMAAWGRPRAAAPCALAGRQMQEGRYRRVRVGVAAGFGAPACACICHACLAGCLCADKLLLPLRCPCFVPLQELALWPRVRRDLCHAVQAHGAAGGGGCGDQGLHSHGHVSTPQLLLHMLRTCLPCVQFVNVWGFQWVSSVLQHSGRWRQVVEVHAASGAGGGGRWRVSVRGR